jgi:ABC-2 type transport system permease protein
VFPLLIKIRLLSARNVVRDTLRRHPVLASGLSLLGIALFVAMYFGFALFFQFALSLDVLEETVYQIFYFLFLFLLAGAVPFVASTLLHSADYGLLFAAPVPPRAVVAAKLLDATVTNSLQFTLLGIPAIAACAGAIGLPPVAWLLLPALVVLFALLPALITALGLLLALAVFGMKRLRAAIALLNTIMALTICITFVLEAEHLPLHPGSGASFATLHASLTPHSPAAHLWPSAWFASALLGLAQNRLSAFWAAWLALGKIALAVGILYGLCIALGGRLLSAASVAEEDEAGNAVGVTGRDDARQWRLLFRAPVAALITKDFKYLWRDSILLSQITMPLILFFVPFLLAFQDTTTPLREEIFPFAIAMIAVIVFMQTSILSLSSLGLENRSFWIVLSSPMQRRALIRAKFVMSVLVSAGFSMLLTLCAGLAFRITAWIVLSLTVLMMLCAVALCGIGVGISAAFPRFVYENPAHRVSAWALILGFFASVGYMMATGLIFGVAWFLTTLPELAGQIRPILYGSIVLWLLFTLFATILPLEIGARRIEVYQWEH